MPNSEQRRFARSRAYSERRNTVICVLYRFTSQTNIAAHFLAQSPLYIAIGALVTSGFGKELERILVRSYDVSWKPAVTLSLASDPQRVRVRYMDV